MVDWDKKMHMLVISQWTMLLTEVLLNPKANPHFQNDTNAPAFDTAGQAVSFLYASDRTTGTVLDASTGDGANNGH